MATKDLKTQYEESRAKFRKSGKSTDKTKFLEIRGKYIIQRQADKKKATDKAEKQAAATKKAKKK